MTSKQRTPPLYGLREKRIFRCLTQADLGAVIGTTQSHYRQIEEGIIRLDVHRAKKLAEHLECTIDELL
jgi:transcriptional regulator with XRE-family HTH domain